MPPAGKAKAVAGPALHRRFRTALAFAETNANAWASARRPRPCSGSHVRQVLLGLCTNDPLLAEVVSWIERQERAMAQEIALEHGRKSA